MKFEMSFDCVGAAFEMNPSFEIAVCVQKVVHHINDGQTEGAIVDANGNRIGRWGFVSNDAPKAFDTKEGLLAGLDAMCPFRADHPRRT